ncbi:MAG: hypothetical protein ACRD1Z_10890, partial [Vicinamibacteria bacterium]
MTNFRRRVAFALTNLLLLALASSAFATTWFPTEITCPVCGAVNTFRVPGSYGSYVYQEPSKLQYVFWPATTDKFLYTCKQCRLTAYMGDFDAIPKDKVDELAKMLQRDAKLDEPLVPYFEIPMVARLPVAEKVYKVLGRDDTFWCEFRRVQGYHLEAASRADEARVARLKALEIAEKFLQEPSSTRKETLVIASSMRRLTGDAEGARRDLQEAKTLTYDSKELGAESSEGLNGY